MDTRPTPPDDFEGREVPAASVDSSALSLIARSEIDMQIATAHKYPRSLKRFRDETLQMVTLDESIARECYYVLLRKQWDPDKRRSVDVAIEGPSARFAEVILSAWGNSRAAARIVSEANGFIVAQGLCHDLERNVAIAFEVQRSILTKNGDRFKQDMVATTGNAASSIALRNAILKVVPKAFWSSMYAAAKKTAMGDFKTLANRRKDALAEFQAFGVRAEAVFAKLGVAGIEDVTLNHLMVLHGILTALKEGDTTPELAFAVDEPHQERGEAVAPRKAAPSPTVAAAAAAGAAVDAMRGAPKGTTLGEAVDKALAGRAADVLASMPAAEPPFDPDVPPADPDDPVHARLAAEDKLTQAPLPTPAKRELKESKPRDGVFMASVRERRILLTKIAKGGAPVDEVLSLLLENPPTDVDPETLENLTRADYLALMKAMP